jgi:hypothetical protein
VERTRRVRALHRRIAPRPAAVALAGPGAASAVAAGLAAAATVLAWRGADFPAQVFRVELFEREGAVLWNSLWYAGHHTAGYGLLFPALAAAVGLTTVAVASAVAAAAAFGALVRHHVGRTAGSAAASIWFGAGTATHVIVGRLPFGLGMALGLAALLALRHRRRGAAGVLTVACALASPVAAVFVALAWSAWALAARSPGGAALAAAAAVPVAAMAVAFPQGGSFPYTWAAFVCSLALVAAFLRIVPRRERTVRCGAVLYGAASVVAFALPTPLGGNIARLGMAVGGPLLLALAPARDRRRPVWAAVAVALLWWQWSPAIDGIAVAGRDPSVHVGYYEPLLEFLRAHHAESARVEVPFTRRHWEAAYVAREFALARGWERQLDIRHNAVLYEPGLTPARYHAWLRELGVRYVALPDASLDPSAAAEAALLRAGQPFLRPVMQSSHWRVWEVVDAAPMVTGPAHLVALDADSFVLDVRARGELLVRVRHTDHWSVTGPGCTSASPDGWTVLRELGVGRTTVRAALARSLPFGGPTDACA